MKKKIKFILNNTEVETGLPPGTRALEYIRDHQRLTATKEGCREGECGACTVLLGQLSGCDAGDAGSRCVQYKAVSSCLLPLGELEGKHVVTLEGIGNGSENGNSNSKGKGKLTPVQQAVVDESASQCGFCTPGIIMSLTGFFLASESLEYEDAIDAMDGNICRCTGYVPVRDAAKKLSGTYAHKLKKSQNRLTQLVQWSILPPYFQEIPERLEIMNNKPEVHPLLAEEPEPPVDPALKTYVAGGTDLLVQRPEELAEGDAHLEFLSQRSDLRGIHQKDNWIYIGAATTTEEFKNSSLIGQVFPKIKDYLKLVSSTIMRNQATLAGNIVNASPIGDLSILLLSLGADVSLTRGKIRRDMPLKDLFKGYKRLDLKKGEIIETIEVPAPHDVWDWRFNFEKVSQRRYLDIASVNTGISLRMDLSTITDVHFSMGGVAPIPFYLEETCGFLRNKLVCAENILEAIQVMEQEIAPINDVRGSAQYKKRLARNLMAAHFIKLFPEKNLERELL